MFTPITSPRISTNPIFQSCFINTPSYNCKNMVRYWKWLKFFINSTSIFFKFICSHNSATYWSSSINFFFHMISTNSSSKLRNFPFFESFHSNTILWWTIFWKRRLALHTLLNIRTRLSFRIFCSILLTSFFRNSKFSSKLINTHCISSVAWTSSTTINYHLRT